MITKINWVHFSDRVSFWLFAAVAFLLPLSFIPLPGLSLDVGKSALFSVGVLVSFILWLIARLESGEVSVPWNFTLLSLAGLLLVLAIAAATSPSPLVSFLGMGWETGTVFSILIFALALFLVSTWYINDERVLSFLVVFI